MKKLKLSLIVLNYISSSFSQIFSRLLKVKAATAVKTLVFGLKRIIGSARCAKTTFAHNVMFKQVQ